MPRTACGTCGPHRYDRTCSNQAVVRRLPLTSSGLASRAWLAASWRWRFASCLCVTMVAGCSSSPNGNPGAGGGNARSPHGAAGAAYDPDDPDVSDVPDDRTRRRIGYASRGSSAGPSSSFGGGPGAGQSCQFLDKCAVLTSSSTVSEVGCTSGTEFSFKVDNRCGEAIACHFTSEDPLPPPFGASVPQPVVWSGSIATGQQTFIRSCYSQGSVECVPAAQAAKCLPSDAPAPTPTPAPTCSTCASHALPACPNPSSNPAAFE